MDIYAKLKELDKQMREFATEIEEFRGTVDRLGALLDEKVFDLVKLEERLTEGDDDA